MTFSMYDSPVDGPSSTLDMELALSAFPAPPSHIPSGSPPSLHRNTSFTTGDRSSIISNNPPPSHPPSTPLPALPLPRTSSSASVMSLAQQPSSEFGVLQKGRSRSGSVLSASVGAGPSSGRAPLKIRTDLTSARPLVRSPTSAAADGPRSPTGSVYSITAGRSAADSLRERVGGLLSLAPNAVASSSSSTLTLGVSTPNLRPVSPAVLPIGQEHSVNLLTAEELNLEKDPVLARALSPMSLGGDTDVGTTPQRTGHQVRGSTESGVGLGPSLTRVDLSQASASRAPPSSFRGKFNSASVGRRRGSAGSASSSTTSNAVSRTISQSRRKPLPGLPGEGDSGDEDLENTPNRARRSDASSYSRENGAASPDIASIISSTPRPSRRMSNRSISSSRSVSTSRSASVHSQTTPRNRSKSKSVSNLQMSLALSSLTRQQSAGDVVDMVGRKTSPPMPNAVPRPPLPAGAEERVRLSRASSAYSAGTSRLSAFSASSGESGSGGYLSFSAASLSKSRLDEEEAYAGIFVEEEEAVPDAPLADLDVNGQEFDPDVSADYGVAFASHRGAYDLALADGREGEAFYTGEAEAMLGAEEEEKSDSDSDIDLHTPLPQILLREGVLSPHSKVLASMTSSGSLGSSLGGRESVASNITSASVASVMTKNGLFKDERNTDRRRRRHRDGRLLREGLGLTTGLGWSDSEDEDAPSPLTNRLSSLALSRNASVSSFKSAATSGRPRLSSSKSFGKAPPHPLSNSLSAHPMVGGVKSAPVSARNSKGDDEDADLEYVLRAGAMGPPSAPPYAHAHAYQKQQSTRNGVPNYSHPLSPDLDASNRGSIASSSGASSGRSRTSPSPPSAYAKKRKGPASTGSAASVFSLTVSIPEGDAEAEAASRKSRTARNGQRSTSPAPTSGTTSSSSTSLPYPPTPSDDDLTTATPSSSKSASTVSPTPSESPSTGLRSKTPTNGKASQISSRMQMRPRAFSSSRSAPASSTSADAEKECPPPIPSKPTAASSSTISTPRPLRLPALQALQPGQPQPKSGSLLGYNRQLHDRQRMASLSSASSSTSSLPAPQTPARPGARAPPASARTMRSYGSLGSGMQPPSTRLAPPPSPGVAGLPRTPSPSPGAKPRTGTGMVYRQTSLPAPSSSFKAGVKTYGRI